MSKIAALQMYDFPYLRAHTDNLWQSIWTEFQKIGFETESKLNRSIGTKELWTSPNLGFAQTCGLPYVSGLRGKVGLIGTPDYGIIPDRPGWYNSVIIARKSDFRSNLSEFLGATFAYNGANSQSGLFAMMFELQAQFGNTRFFGTCKKSGGHTFSANAVIEGHADIAALDAVTWQYLQNALPDINQLKVLQSTTPNPGLPYISAQFTDAESLANAVETAIETLSPADKTPLGLKGIWRAHPEDYDIIAERAALCTAVIAAHSIR